MQTIVHAIFFVAKLQCDTNNSYNDKDDIFYGGKISTIS